MYVHTCIDITHYGHTDINFWVLRMASNLPQLWIIKSYCTPEENDSVPMKSSLQSCKENKQIIMYIQYVHSYLFMYACIYFQV